MNTKFNIQELELEGARLITPFYVEDDRGYFLKNIERNVYKEWGLDADIFEAFETYSTKGVIRGLHFQTKSPQTKIVRVIRGVVHDVLVDLRKDSPTFGKHIDIELSDENRNIVWIPEGFAHGFEVLSDEAIMSYQCIGQYLNGYDSGIRWNDKDINIQWKTQNPIISDRDKALMTYQEFVDQYGGLSG